MKKQARDINGIVLLDKPAAITSNRALQRTKHLFEARKAGHTGSLDPLATGMLPITLGQATKVSAYLLDARKTYRVAATLGVATDTGDADGEIVARADPPNVTVTALRELLAGFEGPLQQIPPMYSALKHKGQPLYRLARKGIEIERAPRSVTVYELSLESLAGPNFEFVVCCSKGTYVRTLVTDIAARLDTHGHVTGLRRLMVEPYREEQMSSLEMLERAATEGPEALDAYLLPIDSALPGWPALTVSCDFASRLQQGQKVPASGSWTPGRVRLYGPSEEFFGIGEVMRDGALTPRRVFLL